MTYDQGDDVKNNDIGEIPPPVEPRAMGDKGRAVASFFLVALGFAVGWLFGDPVRAYFGLFVMGAILYLWFADPVRRAIRAEREAALNKSGVPGAQNAVQPVERLPEPPSVSTKGFRKVFGKWVAWRNNHRIAAGLLGSAGYIAAVIGVNALLTRVFGVVLNSQLICALLLPLLLWLMGIPVRNKRKH